jgi:hypothetical protein
MTKKSDDFKTRETLRLLRKFNGKGPLHKAIEEFAKAEAEHGAKDPLKCKQAPKKPKPKNG